MAITYTAIANTTLSNDATVISITSIPATYTDLRITFDVYATAGGNTLRFGTNTDTTGGYWGQQIMSGYGTGRLVTRLANQNFCILNQRTTTSLDSQLRTTGFIDIFSYRDLNVRKCVYTATGNLSTTALALVERSIGVCQPNATVDSVQLRISAGNLGQGSRMAVYGILRA